MTFEMSESTSCSSCFRDAIIATNSFEMSFTNNIHCYSGFAIHGSFRWAEMEDGNVMPCYMMYNQAFGKCRQGTKDVGLLTPRHLKGDQGSIS